MYTISVRGQFQWGSLEIFWWPRRVARIARRDEKKDELGGMSSRSVGMRERRLGSLFGFDMLRLATKHATRSYSFGTTTSSDGFAAATTGDRMELFNPVRLRGPQDMLKFRLRFTLRMMFAATAVIGMLFGGLAWFVTYLSRIPPGVELVSEIAPSSVGDKVAFVAYHGGYDDRWSGVRDFIARHTGHFPYPESARLVLLDTSDDTTSDLGVGELAGRPIAWATDDSLLAYVSGEFRPNDDRKRLEIYDLASERSDAAFVGSDWYIHALCFSPDSQSLAFVENYNQRNLTILNVGTRIATVLASGVNANELCWSNDGANVFCIRKGQEIWQLGVNKRSEDLLFRGKDTKRNYPCFLVPSPDGRRLGFGYARGFHSLNLSTKAVEKWFDCDHYFLTFDWGSEGICYLDAVGKERKEKARVMVYDPVSRASKEIAVGPFAHVAWLRDGVLIVRKNNAELWELTIHDRKIKRLFPADHR